MDQPERESEHIERSRPPPFYRAEVERQIDREYAKYYYQSRESIIEQMRREMYGTVKVGIPDIMEPDWLSDFGAEDYQLVRQ